MTTINSLALGDTIAVLDSYGNTYNVDKIVAIDSDAYGNYVRLAGDYKNNNKFDKETGNEVWGDRRIRLIDQAEIENRLISLVGKASLTLSIEQLEKCVTAIEQILDKTP